MSSSSSDAEGKMTCHLSPAQLRYIGDQKELAGMLMLFSVFPLLATFNSVATLTPFIALLKDHALTVASYAGALDEAYFSLAAMLIGAATLQGHAMPRWLSMSAIAWTATAWFPFIVSLVSLGMLIADAATTGQTPFLPTNLNPTVLDSNVIGSMQFIGVVVYGGIGAVGSLTMIHLGLHRFLTPEGAATYDAGYYRRRLVFYGIVTVIGAGLAQLVIGAYALARKGPGPYSPPISNGPFVVTWPEVAITMGLVNTFLGAFTTYVGWRPSNARRQQQTSTFMAVSGICLVLLLTLQVVAQAPQGISANGDLGKPADLLFLLPLSLLPMFLEARSHLAPEVIPEGYYQSLDSHDGDDDNNDVPDNEDDTPAALQHQTSMQVYVITEE